MSQVAFQPEMTARLARVPQAMREAPIWLLHRAKQPFYADGSARRGRLDAPEDRARLVTLDIALARLAIGGFDGVGVALGPDGRGGYWQGIDGDNLPDRPHVAALFETLPGYREVSPSGRGQHVISYGLRSFAPLGANGSGLEAYAGSRYFTVTGDSLGGEPTTCLADTVERRVRPLHSPAATTPTEPAPARPEAVAAAIVPTDALMAELRSALAVVSPDEGYHTWLNMGMRLKCLGDAGLNLYVEWSKRSVAYNLDELLSKWAGFQPVGTSFKAVFHEAQQRGWQNPNRHPNAGLTVPDAIKAGTFTVNGQPFYQTGATFSIKSQLAATTALTFPPVTLNEWLSARQSPTPIVANYYYADVGVLVAPGGTGKTTCIAWQAVHIALGWDFWGLKVLKPGPVMILTAEDSRELLVARLRLICAALNLTDEQTQLVAERVRIGDVSGTGFRLTQVDRDVVRPADGPLTQLIEAAKAISPVLMVIDPAVSFGVGESRVNDAEGGLIEAGRRIVREVGCCLLYVHHSGKANAREKTTDQYSGRGGSAFADGSRMVHVLQPVTPADWLAETGDELQPGETGLILARPKGSYSVPQGPLYIKRRGYRFDAFDRRVRDKEQQRDDADHRVWRLLTDELAAGRYHSARSLDGIDSGMKRAELRHAVTRLLASGRVQERDRPDAQARGARKYLHPLAAVGEDGAQAPQAQQETLLNHWQDERRTNRDV